MKNATHNRISRLLPLLIFAGLAYPASTVSAGLGVWTSGGPYGGDIYSPGHRSREPDHALCRRRRRPRRLQVAPTRASPGLPPIRG